MFLQRPQEISDCGEGKYRLRFNAACSEDSRVMPLCTICNKTQQRGLSHARLALNHYSAAPNIQRFHEPTEQMSLMFTANHDAGVVQVAVFESLGPMVRPASNWALLGPGEFGYAHGSLGLTR